MPDTFVQTSDLDRLTKPCPECNGAGGHFKARSVHDEEWIVCPTCHGTKVIPAESPDEYIARLRGLAEQARAERDEEKALTKELARFLHIRMCRARSNCSDDCDACLKNDMAMVIGQAIQRIEAARAVAGKDS